MRIGPKLLGSFLVMLAFAGVIGIVAVVQLSTVAKCRFYRDRVHGQRLPDRRNPFQFRVDAAPERSRS